MRCITAYHTSMNGVVERHENAGRADRLSNPNACCVPSFVAFTITSDCYDCGGQRCIERGFVNCTACRTERQRLTTEMLFTQGVPVLRLRRDNGVEREMRPKHQLFLPRSLVFLVAHGDAMQLHSKCDGVRGEKNQN